MISVSAGDYHGGQYLMGGLSSLGQGIGDALKQWQQMKDEQTKADAMMQMLGQTDNPLNPGKPILDQKAMQGYSALSSQRHAAAAAGMMGSLQIIEAMRNAASETALKGAQTREASARATALAKEDAPFTPTGQSITLPGDQTPINLIQTSRKQYQIAPGSQPVSPMMGQTYYHPDTGKAIGTYDENGKVQFFPGQGPDLLSALFGAGAGGAGAGGQSTLNVAPPQPATAPPAAVAPAPKTPAAGKPVAVAPSYGVKLNAQDQQALAWAQSNPKDPRAAAILQKLAGQ